MNAMVCPQCGDSMEWFHDLGGWVCNACGRYLPPQAEEEPEEEDYETVGQLWLDEQSRVRSMSRPGGSRSSGRRRKYRRVYVTPQPVGDEEDVVRTRAAELRRLPAKVRRRYVQELQRRYAQARTRREKSLLISEMEALGYHRKAAIRRLRRPFERSLATDAVRVSCVLTALVQVLTSTRVA